MKTKLTPVVNILKDLREERMIILVDDERRENEGDLVISASVVIPDHINFMATHGRGLVCLAMSDAEINRLGFPLMVENNQCLHNTAFTISIDAREGVGTGISAYDRAQTIRLAASPFSTIADFRMPGHVFPLKARKSGLDEREGHTEAAVELSRLAGLGNSAVICEIMDEGGHMMRLPALLDFAKKHHLKICRIADIKSYHNRFQKKAA